MEFIAINLDDFHKNQNNEPRTNASMIFVDAPGIIEAKEYIKLNHPESPWAVVSKKVIDANIVTRQVYLVN